MDGEPSREARAAASVLTEAAKALRDISDGLVAGAAALLQQDPAKVDTGVHVCRPPANAAPFEIFRCSCGTAMRQYPGPNGSEWKAI